MASMEHSHLVNWNANTKLICYPAWGFMEYLAIEPQPIGNISMSDSSLLSARFCWMHHMLCLSWPIELKKAEHTLFISLWWICWGGKKCGLSAWNGSYIRIGWTLGQLARQHACDNCHEFVRGSRAHQCRFLLLIVMFRAVPGEIIPSSTRRIQRLICKDLCLRDEQFIA